MTTAPETEPNSERLRDRVDELAHTPVLLVACDYDGTLAPIVDDPTRAHPDRDSVVALRGLAALPDTHVAVISGRALADLGRLTGLPHDVHLVGSHGSEFDPDFAERLGAGERALLARVVEDLQHIASGAAGLVLEVKPASVAFHYRNAAPDAARAALDQVLRGPGALPGVHVRHGKHVVELLLFETDKGDALERIRRRVGATAVLFLGDDVTDEDAFATLTGPDVGVKVGEGESRGEFRVGDTGDVARLLARLAMAREDWCECGTAVPIERHALLSDQRTVALVTPHGRISWLCLPRIDSSAVFAELVDGPNAGFFAVRSAQGDEPVEQRYRPASLALETEWRDFVLTDFFDCSLGRPRQRPGRSDLLRILRRKDGPARVVVEFAPRLDFGRVATRIVARESGLRVEGANDPLVLRSPGVAWEIVQQGAHCTARAEVDLPPEGLVLDLRYGTADLGDTRRKAADRLSLSDAYWSTWAAQLVLPEVQSELVLRSALLLKALVQSPSGGIAAAATTSLPEHLGGGRNWDYRFCWLRDAALTARALLALESAGEALSYLDWVLEVVEDSFSPSRLQPLYGVGGEAVPPDAEIRELSGYRGSRPVRIGNSAAHQVQLDVFGSVVDLVHALLLAEAPLSAKHARLVEAMVQAVAERWREPDHGIWELRQERHHVHSKTMCWLTLDRAVAVARHLLDRDVTEWERLRDEIAADILQHGWNPEVGAFTESYGSDELDAAVLHVGLTGLVAPDDPRFARTIEAVERELRLGPTVYRYHLDDGLAGIEGGFHVCASWLVDAYLLVGREADARELFESIAALAGPTGLLSEQVDPETRTALGNVPQAYSHLGLIENAVRLDRVGR